MDYHVVDVFAEAPLAGNPLTVLPDAGGLPDALMQALARETNHSETTFVAPLRDGAWPTRIFTPAAELPFAGHPMLGTAHVLRRRHGLDGVVLETRAGRIPVRAEGDRLWMTQNTPAFGPLLPAERFLNVEAAGPAQVVSTGTPMALVPVQGSDAVREARLDADAYRAAGLPEVACVYVFALDHDIPGALVHARSFGDFVGIREDPATGSAAGPLAAYLVEQGLAGGGAEVEGWVAQGIEMGRPSRLDVRARNGSDGWLVEVGGRVVDVATGRFEDSLLAAGPPAAPSK